MHNNHTRAEFIDKVFDATNYINQARGVLISMLEAEGSDTAATWRYGALLTLMLAASNEIESVLNSFDDVPEDKE